MAQREITRGHEHGQTVMGACGRERGWRIFYQNLRCIYRQGERTVSQAAVWDFCVTLLRIFSPL